jgi:hypothetical protein
VVAQPRAASGSPAQASWLKTDVGVLTLGPLQLAYSPGEVFPCMEVLGPIDEAQMPFPTNCYEPLSRRATGAALLHLRSGCEQLIGAGTRQAGARPVAAEKQTSALDEIEAVKWRKTTASLSPRSVDGVPRTPRCARQR